MADMPGQKPQGANDISARDSNGELERLRALAKQLTEENGRLKQELEQEKSYSAGYLRTLQVFAPQYTFTQEQIDDMRVNGVSGRQVLQDLEAIMQEPL
jgi:hypothetical protein